MVGGDAVFSGGGDVGADGGELFGSVEGAQAAGDFLPDLSDPDFLLGGVVRRRDAGVGGEVEVVPDPGLDPEGQGPVFLAEFPGGEEVAVDGGHGGVEEARPVGVEGGRVVDDFP